VVVWSKNSVLHYLGGGEKTGSWALGQGRGLGRESFFPGFEEDGCRSAGVGGFKKKVKKMASEGSPFSGRGAQGFTCRHVGGREISKKTVS